MAQGQEVVGLTAKDMAAITALADLDEEHLETIAKRCRGLKVRAGSEVVGYEDTTTDVYFIVSGSVRASAFAATGRHITFQILRAGAMFGELSAIDGLPRSSNVFAEEDCLLARLSAQSFCALMRANPDFSFAITLRVVEMARWLRTRVFEYHAYDVKGRVYSEVLRLADDARTDPAVDALVIQPAPTDADLASRVGTTRENVNRIINGLKANQVAERTPDGLRVHSVNVLKQWLAASEAG
ncbi:MAG: Crp/Fnr family transcriptional regulator [Gammaproteobacteria bacterium]|nr:Crp/Fnr family transcriptional regulator [Gammaproteobacteria bacterium]